MMSRLMIRAMGLCLGVFAAGSASASDTGYDFTWGGHVRERVNYANADLFGIRGRGEDGYLLHRVMVHGDLSVGDHVRVFGEVGQHIEKWRDSGPGPFDENRLDMHQAFLDLTAPIGGGSLTFSTGRQAMPMGSSRLIGKRFGPNVPLAFNAVRGIYETEYYKLQAFAGHPVEIFPSSFDDNSDGAQDVWGVYSTLSRVFNSPHNIDLYYIGLDRENSEFAQGTADEERHSVGFRLFGKDQAWDWNVEGVYQFGDFGNGDINAWTLASDNGYTFIDATWTPRIGLSANYASGDDDPSDNDLQTFNPLFPKLAYFNEASILSPQNFFNVHPSLTLTPHKSVTVKGSWNAFWRAETSDGVYTRGLSPLTPANDNQDRFVAHVPTLDLAWSPRENLTFNASYSRFIASDTIEAAGGDDVDSLVAWVTYTF